MVKEAVGETSEKFFPHIEPMLPREAKRLPIYLPDWIIEPKCDGIRALVEINRSSGKVNIRTKQGSDISSHFPEILPGLNLLALRHSLILDGEIIYQDGKKGRNRPVVARAQSNPENSAKVAGIAPCYLVVFDFLYKEVNF